MEGATLAKPRQLLWTSTWHLLSAAKHLSVSCRCRHQESVEADATFEQEVVVNYAQAYAGKTILVCHTRIHGLMLLM